jgi:DNA-binding PadR family transcriptional regulator
LAVSRNQLLVLRYLATCNAPVAGIDVAADLDWIATSSIYAAVSALQARGQVTARWDHSEPHPRRMISLNEAGRGAIADADRIDALATARFGRPEGAKS